MHELDDNPNIGTPLNNEQAPRREKNISPVAAAAAIKPSHSNDIVPSVNVAEAEEESKSGSKPVAQDLEEKEAPVQHAEHRPTLDLNERDKLPQIVVTTPAGGEHGTIDNGFTVVEMSRPE